MGAALATAGAASLPVTAAARIRAGQDDDTIARLGAQLARHAGFGDKESGTFGELATADWIASELQASGFALRTDSFTIPRFEARVAMLQLGSRQIAVKPQPVVVPTSAAGITAGACIIRRPYQAKDAAGHIAFVVAPYGRHASINSAEIKPLLAAAVTNGAAAIIIVPEGPTGGIIGLNTNLQPVADIPMAILAPADFAVIEQALAEGQPATLTISGEHLQKESRNIIATRSAGQRWIVFTTPRTGWFTAAAERGTGTAVFLELARWAIHAFPHHSLLAINSGAHELAFAGMHRAMADVPPPASVDAWAHIGAGLATHDRLMLGNRSLGLLPTAEAQRVLMTTAGLLPMAKAAFDGLSGFERPIVPVKGAGELSGIIDAGYARVFGGLGVHPWFHTAEDTLDKTDPGLLLPVLHAHMRFITALVTSAS